MSATSKRIIWQAPDGSIHVTTPVEPPLPGEAEADYLDRVGAKAQKAPVLAGCVRVADVEAKDLPSRRFRGAWRWQAGASRVVAELGAAKDLLAAEIALRPKADAGKVGRVRAGIASARAVEELEALATREGWRTPVVKVPPPADTGEDF